MLALHLRPAVQLRQDRRLRQPQVHMFAVHVRTRLLLRILIGMPDSPSREDNGALSA